MCSRFLVFLKRGSACSEMPEDAASLMTATGFLPLRKAAFSARLTWSWLMPFSARGSLRVVPSAWVTNLHLRPVISAILLTPNCATSMSSALPGILIRSSCATRLCFSSMAGCDSAPSAKVVGICFSSTSLAISCGVLTSPSSSLPATSARSAASFALASPVETRPITTHLPCSSALRLSAMAKRALSELSSCLKKDWCCPQ
mmetsp:Transcript_46137/g.110619  ORF Transcript_46137/g.110619 Transcript_46137/m.110619 type:complete len:202 (+) Transcript_46137:1540-2145(+)